MDAAVRGYLAECRTLPGLDLDIDGCLHVWEAAMALPGADRVVSPRWLHGDPTVDIVVAWELLDRAGRDLFRSLVRVDEATWLRGRAWALAIAAMTFPYSWDTMPDRCAARLALAHAVLTDAAGPSPTGR